MRASFGCPVLVFGLLTLASACGGGAASTGQAESPASATSTARAADDDRGPSEGSDGSETESGAEVAEGPRGPSCDDGTCSKCGSGICPAGWYCDEKAPGGAACSWLAECAEKPSCGCVTRALGSGCKCREEAGGLKVACD